MSAKAKSVAEEPCEACPQPLSFSQARTPVAAIPTPHSRRMTFSNIFFPSQARKASEQGLSSKTTSPGVPTPFRALPTARTSRAYSGSFSSYFGTLPNIRSSFSTSSSDGNKIEGSRSSTTAHMEDLKPSTSLDKGMSQASGIGESLTLFALPDQAQSPRPILRVDTNISENVEPRGPILTTEDSLSPTTPPLESAHSVRFSEHLHTIIPSVHPTSIPTETSWPVSLPDVITLKTLLDKYDPKCPRLPAISSIAGHRDIVADMYVKLILYEMDNLHKNYMIINATNKSYESIQGPDRLEVIRRSLTIYTSAIRDFEYWKSSFIHEDVDAEGHIASELSTSQLRIAALLELADHSPSTVQISDAERVLLQHRAEALKSHERTSARLGTSRRVTDQDQTPAKGHHALLIAVTAVTLCGFATLYMCSADGLWENLVRLKLCYQQRIVA